MYFIVYFMDIKRNFIVPKQWIKDIKLHKEKFYNNSCNHGQAFTCFYTTQGEAFLAGGLPNGQFPANFDAKPSKTLLANGPGLYRIKLKKYKRTLEGAQKYLNSQRNMEPCTYDEARNLERPIPEQIDSDDFEEIEEIIIPASTNAVNENGAAANTPVENDHASTSSAEREPVHINANGNNSGDANPVFGNIDNDVENERDDIESSTPAENERASISSAEKEPAHIETNGNNSGNANLLVGSISVGTDNEFVENNRDDIESSTPAENERASISFAEKEPAHIEANGNNSGDANLLVGSISIGTDNEFVENNGKNDVAGANANMSAGKVDNGPDASVETTAAENSISETSQFENCRNIATQIATNTLRIVNSGCTASTGNEPAENNANKNTSSGVSLVVRSDTDIADTDDRSDNELPEDGGHEDTTVDAIATVAHNGYTVDSTMSTGIGDNGSSVDSVQIEEARAENSCNEDTPDSSNAAAENGTESSSDENAPVEEAETTMVKHEYPVFEVGNNHDILNELEEDEECIEILTYDGEEMEVTYKASKGFGKAKNIMADGRVKLEKPDSVSGMIPFITTKTGRAYLIGEGFHDIPSIIFEKFAKLNEPPYKKNSYYDKSLVTSLLLATNRPEQLAANEISSESLDFVREMLEFRCDGHQQEQRVEAITKYAEELVARKRSEKQRAEKTD